MAALPLAMAGLACFASSMISSVLAPLMGGEEKEDPVVPKTPIKKKSPEQIKADEAKVVLDALKAEPDATPAEVAAAQLEADNAAAAATAAAADADAGDTSDLYTHVGDGGCHNDYVFAANECRAAHTSSDTVGQQGNGCWHCLKSGGGTITQASYPKYFDAISNIQDGYSFTGDGGCTNAIEVPLGKCNDNTECIAAGQQGNGCWHLLKEGDGPLSTYKKYIR